MILAYHLSVLDYDQGNLIVQIAQNIQTFRHGIAFYFDQVFMTVFLAADRLEQGNGLFLVFQMQQLIDVHSLSFGDVVDDHTILNRFYF